MDIYLSLSRIRNSMSSEAVSWRTLIGARTARSMEIVWWVPFFSIVRVCYCTDTTRNGPSARVCNLLYVVMATIFEDSVAAAESDGRSPKTMSPVINIGVTRTSLSR